MNGPVPVPVVVAGCWCCCGMAAVVAVAVAVDGGFETEAGIVSPAFGGGGIDEEVDDEPVGVGAVGSGVAPGCGGGGDWVDVVVDARVVVGVAVSVVPAALPVGAGRLGAAPGSAVA